MGGANQIGLVTGEVALPGRPASQDGLLAEEGSVSSVHRSQGQCHWPSAEEPVAWA
jgi:hypothetical protein